MYSVVMATMLTVGAGSSTGFGHHHRCHGCHGCHGYSYCHGCSGCSCYGCYGCYGCCGGCCGGYASYGHYSSYCSGCFGCSGCYGCSGYYGCSGCYGCYGSYGCCGGCCGGVIYSAPVTYAPVVPAVPVAPVLAPRGEPVSKTDVARLTVKLPANARLWVDNVNCPLSSSERSFNTPPLNPGQQYFYTLRMEVDRDGQTVSENRRVYVAAGARVNVDFNTPAAVTASR